MADVIVRPRRERLSPAAETLRQIRRRWFCYFMMFGTMALLVVFAYFPAFSAFYHSFTIWDGFTPARWAGLKNFREVFTHDVFRKGFANMGWLVGWEVVRSAVFPLICAALMYRLRREGTAYFFRLVYVLPVVVPWVVAVLVWKMFYDPNIGLFNDILRGLGLQGSGWLTDPKTALRSLMFMGFPWMDGVAVLIFLAGLLAIPLEVVEASIVDGCGSSRRFFAIELPLIIPQIRLIVILRVISAMQGFGWQFLVTGGGPVYATTVPAYRMYTEAMGSARFGLGCAVGLILFIVIFGLTLINNKVIKADVEYDAN